jgi:hypothetical protein
MDRRLTLAAILCALCLACASTRLTQGGAAVKVYETDRPHGQPEASLPAGCRMLSATAPFRQQASERVNVKDPYRAERNATADRGGNILLVRSSRIVDLKRTECPTVDRSTDCQATDQSWFDVTLESYACDAPALAVLSESTAAQPQAFWWPLGDPSRKTSTSTAAAPAAPASAPAPAPAAAATPASPPSPTGLSAAELKTKLLALMQEGVGGDVLVAYVKSRRVAAPLSAEEIVDWKRAGIPEPVIEAAIAQGTVH